MDLVDWLRVHATGDDFSDDLMEQAANEIERLREDRNRMASLAIDNAKDTERAMRYREALRPFAERASVYDPDEGDDDDCDWYGGGPEIKIGDLRRARAALKEGE